MPWEDTGGPTGSGVPPEPMRRTETLLDPALTASRNRPSAERWIAPCEPRPLPRPAPPVRKGEPGIGVSDPSACRTKTATVLAPAALSFTYVWPTTGEPGGAAAAVPVRPARPNASRLPPTANVVLVFMCGAPLRSDGGMRRFD